LPASYPHAEGVASEVLPKGGDVVPDRLLARNSARPISALPRPGRESHDLQPARGQAGQVGAMDEAAVSLEQVASALARRTASHARRRCVELAAKHPNDQDDDHDENDGSEADIH
jgi:hypothetical protein